MAADIAAANASRASGVRYSLTHSLSLAVLPTDWWAQITYGRMTTVSRSPDSHAFPKVAGDSRFGHGSIVVPSGKLDKAPPIYLGVMMPRGPKGRHRPADTNAAAIMVAKIATGEIEDVTTDEGKNRILTLSN